MNDTPFRLTVLSGPNAGASVPLKAGRTVIGGAAADAIVLDGALPAHLGLTLQGERIRLVAGGPGVAIGDGDGPDAAERLAEGKARILPLPVMVRLNEDTLLNVARRVPVTGRAVPAAMAALASIVALAGGLLVGLQMPDSVRAASGMTAQASPAPAPAPIAPPLAATVAPRAPSAPLRAMSPQMGPCDDACRSEAQARLRARLDEAGMKDLALDVQGGVLRVRGALPPDGQARWADLRRDFEMTYGGSLPLLVAIGPEAGGPQLAVSSIWLGARPEIRTRNGEVLRVGDATADGWTVSGIDRGAVTLSRNDSEVVVRW
ncbi:hypothetical protein [Paracoccus contaminans]|uniref:Yop protein translocation protein D periplasmic domain-containing protein n=1 Tax=Paracoccus contaminans TaxID=1945662 RepID=A0A1W6D036_9RHOB|nr:hypothetical protein [Paracoccus contaminans]ARJ70458.1 hypothetical protein B0A89_13235 [Paracoccus contaminans]